MRGLLGYVPYGNDAVVVVNFVVAEFIRVGVNDWRCHHSCDVERLEVGIASRSIFGSPLRDEFLLDRWEGLILPNHFSWVFRSKGRVEEDVLNVDDPFGKLVHFLISIEKYAQKYPGVWSICHTLRPSMTESGMGYGVNPRCLTFFPIARLRNL